MSDKMNTQEKRIKTLESRVKELEMKEDTKETTVTLEKTADLEESLIDV